VLINPPYAEAGIKSAMPWKNATKVVTLHPWVLTNSSKPTKP
jgi:hypothetical protein